MLEQFQVIISPIAGLNITGVFTGTPKDFVRSSVVTKRKGVNIGGLDKSSIRTYTFIPPRATALTAREVFAEKQLKSLESVIQLSRSEAGAFVVNINTASLLETTKSKQLEVFNTQSKIRPFSATVDPSLVIAHIFSAVDTASRQVQNAKWLFSYIGSYSSSSSHRQQMLPLVSPSEQSKAFQLPSDLPLEDAELDGKTTATQAPDIDTGLTI